MERGILTCVQSTQIKVVSQIQKLLSIIFYIHPQANQNQPTNERQANERTANDRTALCGVIGNIEQELPNLFNVIKRVVDDGLSAYEKPNAPVTSLYFCVHMFFNFLFISYLLSAYEKPNAPVTSKYFYVHMFFNFLLPQLQVIAFV